MDTATAPDLTEKSNDELKVILTDQGKDFRVKDNKATLITLIENDSEPEAEMEPEAEEKLVLELTQMGRFPGRKANKLSDYLELHQVDSGREGRGKWNYETRDSEGNVLFVTEANYEVAKRATRAKAVENNVAFDIKTDYHRDGIGPEQVREAA